MRRRSGGQKKEKKTARFGIVPSCYGIFFSLLLMKSNFFLLSFRGGLRCCFIQGAIWEPMALIVCFPFCGPAATVRTLLLRLFRWIVARSATMAVIKCGGVIGILIMHRSIADTEAHCFILFLFFCWDDLQQQKK